LRTAIWEADGAISDALADYDYRAATEAAWRIAVAANRYVERARPWELARDGSPELDTVLGALLYACQAIGGQLGPFLPDAAARITRQCTTGPDGRLPGASPVQRRLQPPALSDVAG
jgi:methionyl-tRNA synthetase